MQTLIFFLEQLGLFFLSNMYEEVEVINNNCAIFFLLLRLFFFTFISRSLSFFLSFLSFFRLGQEQN